MTRFDKDAVGPRKMIIKERFTQRPLPETQTCQTIPVAAGFRFEVSAETLAAPRFQFQWQRLSPRLASNVPDLAQCKTREA
jgi:hypothetical protein